MQANEVLMWQYWLTMEPRGMRRHDYHAAQITQSVMKVITSFGNNKAKISLSDCLLKFKNPHDEKVRETNIKNAMIAMALFGGDIREKIGADLDKATKVDSEDTYE